MKWFDNLKISYKFIGCFTAILIILMVGNIRGVMNTSSLNNNLVNIYENDLTMIKELGEISSSFNRINTALGSYLLVNDKDSRNARMEIINTKVQTINDLLTHLSGIPLLDNERQELDLFKQLWSTYQSTIDKVVNLTEQNQDQFAQSVFQRELLSKEEGINTTFQGFIAKNQQKADARYENSLTMYTQIKWSSIILMALSLAIAGILGYFMTRSFVAPIGRLLKSFKYIESGDLSHPIVEHRRDELGMLAEGSEKMRQSISLIVSQTKSLVGTLSDVSNQIREDALETGDSSQSIYHGLREIAVTSKEQATKIVDDAVMIKEMTLGLNQMAVTVDDVSNLSSDMENTAGKGRLVVRDALETMKSIKQKSEQTTTIVGMLGEHSKEINSVISTIKAIAEETNLLALNASIEAARAGEAGRGFAVVASEIRKLAENSTSSAELVRQIVVRTQQSTQDLLSSSQAWMMEIHEGHIKMDDVSEAFQRIFEWVENMNSSIQDITAGIEELSAGSVQIDHSMKRIEDYSDGVSQVNQEYSDKSGQQVKRMGKVNSSADELLKLSDELHVIVNRFVTA